MTVTLNLAPDTERRLRAKAAQLGQTLEGSLERLALEEAEPGNGPGQPADPALALPDFDRHLEALSKGLPPLPPLPADFSRADSYADHDWNLVPRTAADSRTMI
jgi:hypothetical protein